MRPSFFKLVKVYKTFYFRILAHKNGLRAGEQGQKRSYKERLWITKQ
jgi:hypothetical protein